MCHTNINILTKLISVTRYYVFDSRIAVVYNLKKNISNILLQILMRCDVMFAYILSFLADESRCLKMQWMFTHAKSNNFLILFKRFYFFIKVSQKSSQNFKWMTKWSLSSFHSEQSVRKKLGSFCVIFLFYQEKEKSSLSQKIKREN